MNILEVNYADIVGRRFDGYDLHLELRKQGMEVKQLVLEKRSTVESVIALQTDNVLQQQIKNFEYKYSINNMLRSQGTNIGRLDEFRNADIVHYHILYHGLLSIPDYPKLMNQKKSIWTIHDPWIVTGNCIHPLDCDLWKNGCIHCERIENELLKLAEDNTHFLWNMKKEFLGQINPDIIVSCNFMKKYIESSPITKHFDKIHIISFGIKTSKFHTGRGIEYRRKYGIDENAFCIGFRADDKEIKGCSYLYRALEEIQNKNDIVLFCMGGGSIPQNIKETYKIIDLGWVDDEQIITEFFEITDLFIMPSLAETFGMMAVEAMAAECAVMCFEGTVLEEITYAPKCGITVPYLDSEKMAEEIVSLEKNRDLVKQRGKMGHEIVKEKYTMEQYVDSHRKLYEDIYEREEYDNG